MTSPLDIKFQLVPLPEEMNAHETFNHSSHVNFGREEITNCRFSTLKKQLAPLTFTKKNYLIHKKRDILVWKIFLSQSANEITALNKVQLLLPNYIIAGCSTR